MKTPNSLIKIGTIVGLLLVSPLASAQLGFSIVSKPGSTSVLNNLVVGGGKGTQSDPVRLSLTLAEVNKAGRLQVSGLTKIGQAGSTAFRNSAWLEITLKNVSKDDWGSLILGLFNKLDMSVSYDGLSFGSLSDRSAHLLKPDAKTTSDLGVNPWSFSASVTERDLNFYGWYPEVKYPNGAVVADFLIFSAAAKNDKVGLEEGVKINVLVSQNGRDDISFLNLAASPIPEIPWTGLISGSLLCAFVIIRRRCHG